MDTYNYFCVQFYKIWIHTVILVYIFLCTYNNMSGYTLIEST